MSRKPAHIFISACEPSGDLLGAELITALRNYKTADIEISGIGGSAMASCGVKSLLSVDGLAVMGLGDVLPVIRRSLDLARRAADIIDQARPDILVTIDSMGFHKQVARRARKQNPSLKTIHYGAPKYWAWWPGRANRIRGLFDDILGLFPFEPAFFEKYDLPCRFVGHPVVNRMTKNDEDVLRLKEKLALSYQAVVVVFLPGSRPAEVGRLMPVFSETAQILSKAIADLVVIIPTTPLVSKQVHSAAVQWGIRPHMIEGEVEKVAAFHLGQAAVAASGTVSLELAACDLPQITAYKVGPISAMIAKTLIQTEHVNLVNILSDKPIVPEFLQGDCRPERLAQATLDLLSNADHRAQQSAAYAQVLSDLGSGGEPPSIRAADAIMQHFPECGP